MYVFTDNLFAVTPRWEYETFRVCDHIWRPNADFSSTPIFSLTQAHQHGFPGPMPRLQCLCHRRFHLYR